MTKNGHYRKRRSGSFQTTGSIMFRYRFRLPNEATGMRYGVPLTDALASSDDPKRVFFVSGNDILEATVSVLVVVHFLDSFS